MAVYLNTFPLVESLRSGDEEWVSKVRQDLGVIQTRLRAEGLSAYKEPEKLPPGARSYSLSIGSSELQSFCLFAARFFDEDDWRPVAIRSKEEIGKSRKALFELSTMLCCHVILPALSSTAYLVPVDFTEWLCGDELPGYQVGSSMKLSREMVKLAAPLGINLDNGQEVPSARANVSPELQDERMVWRKIYSAVQCSIEFNTAMLWN